MGYVEDFGKVARNLKEPRLSNPLGRFVLKVTGLALLLILGIGVAIEVVRALLN